MTRINVVPVKELADQWLLAEYRELPRVIKGSFDITNAPEVYCLGKGHVKWAKKHIHYVLLRYHDIYYEMLYRNFKPNYTFNDLLIYATADWYREGLIIIDDYYQVTDEDIKINRERLIEKYKLKPNFYKWTNREKPEWLEGEFEMTQRIFDVENEKDMADLWDILPDMVKAIEKDDIDSSETKIPYNRYMGNGYCIGGCPYIAIKWHDKTEITRPIKEATEADIGKICEFWNYQKERTEYKQIGVLTKIKDRIEDSKFKYQLADSINFEHCRRLTKQEVEKLI